MDDQLQPLVIDPFKSDLFDRLKAFNEDIRTVFEKVCVAKGGRYFYRAEPDREVSNWFDIYRLHTIPLPLHYPDLVPLNYDEKFSLLENFPNYISLFLADLLLPREAMIEDRCCGQAKFVYYLSKCGFVNFSLIDNFSQIRREFLDETMKIGNIQFTLNAPLEDVQPVMVNQVSYPKMIRPVTETTQLVCLYAIMREAGSELCRNGFRHLCTDVDQMTLCFARTDKHDEFRNKLLPFSV